MLPMTKKDRHLNSDIPEDVLQKILCRLPIKSLIGLSCVSKRWQSIILSDPQLGQAHLKLATERRTITRRLILSVVPYQFKSLEDSFGYQSLVRNLTIPSGENEKLVISSCNGLVAVGNIFNGWSIWNPSTGFERKLPLLDYSLVMKKARSDEEYDSDNIVLDGFGYVSSTDDYKLVLVPFPDDSGSRVVNVFIFSVRENSWKLRQASRWPSGSYSPTTNSGTLSNEAIHWINHYTERNNNIEGNNIEVCAFDLENEKLRKVPGPSFKRVHRGFNRRMKTVVHAGGCLCVWSETYDVEGRPGGYIDLWMMRDYGVSNSWKKLCKLQKKDLHDVLDPVRFWEPSFVTESGEIVILLDNKELVRIKCLKKKRAVFRGRFRLKKELECKLLGATLYDETVVSLAE
uniref:F-box/kelch-repeat protein At3g06240-like n=1 Tax=Fragaria vesca subsp. vesca TaxID=101020 RepID=UPI0005CA8A3C|nr:PREDICTED: F-box/kelch-repeat protein At3g06240-like [Fragaria vesca subsp. vesca]XP_011461624.1 PREDICTED: F-box/kelch-repeat protein At3g06240-like [Fragaria vesca subsp. vesca]